MTTRNDKVFHKKARERGWRLEDIAARWGISVRQMSRVANNPKQRDLDAVNGLPSNRAEPQVWLRLVYAEETGVEGGFSCGAISRPQGRKLLGPQLEHCLATRYRAKALMAWQWGCHWSTESPVRRYWKMTLKQHLYIWTAPLVSLALIAIVYKPLTITQATAVVILSVPLSYASNWLEAKRKRSRA